MEGYLLIFFIFICLLLIAYILAIKVQIRFICRDLKQNLDPSYDRQLSVALFDKSLNSLAVAINHILDDQRRLKREVVRSENNLKQSVSDIAHDLRTPMTVIKGNLQMLSQEEHISEHGREYLTICHEKADKLKEMADAFFELTILESSDVSAEIQQVNLTKVLMQFLADSEATIRLHGLEPQIVFPEKTVYIRADEHMLTRMLENVLNNILKYAQDTFRLEIQQGEEECTVSFSNPVREGEMPDTQMMFERSYRADASRSGGSAGLGLFIVRLLAERQNAKVEAESERGVLTLNMKFTTKRSIQ